MRPANAAAPAAARINLVLVIRVVLVIGEKSHVLLRDDPQVEPNALRARNRGKLESLLIAGVVRELRIDVRNVRVRPQVVADEREIYRRRVESRSEARRQIDAEANVAQLDPAVVVGVLLGVVVQ